MLALGKILHCRGVDGNRLVEIRESFNRDDNENVEYMAFARTAEKAVARAIACYAFDDVFVDPDPTNETGSFMTQDTLNSGPLVSKFDAMVLNGYVKSGTISNQT